MSFPSITRSAGGSTPAARRTVGKTSIDPSTAPDTWPGGILPGHRAIAGTRTPAVKTGRLHGSQTAVVAVQTLHRCRT